MNLLRLSRPILPLVALGLVLLVIDPAAAVAKISVASPLPLLAALALSQVVIWASALRWWVTVHGLGRELGLGQAIAEYYVSSLFNILLPGGMGGDALRVGRNRGQSLTETGEVLRGVVIERLSGQVALAAVLFVGLVCGGALRGSGPLIAVFLATVGCAVIALAFGGKLPGKIGTGLSTFAEEFRQLASRPSFLFKLAGLNIAVVAALVGGFWLCTFALGEPVPPATALVLIPVCLAAMLIPVGIGGLGLREGAAAALWPLAGLAADAGVAASLLFALVNLLGALPALLPLAIQSKGSDCIANGAAAGE